MSMKTKIEIEYEITLKALDEEITRYAWSLPDLEKYLHAFSILMEAEGPGPGERLPRIEVEARLVETVDRDGETIHNYAQNL